MDLHEWELLPDDGFLEIHDDGGTKIFSRKFGTMDPVLHMNHFIYPSSSDSQTTNDPKLQNRLVPVPIQLHPVPIKPPDRALLAKRIDNSPSEATDLGFPSPESDKIRSDQDPVSQVSFKNNNNNKKKKEPEFVDIKVDSPKSHNARAILPQIDSGIFHFVDKEEGHHLHRHHHHQQQQHQPLDCRSPSKVKPETEKRIVGPESGGKEDEEVVVEEGNGFNLWKWSLTGIGAICSFGVAAAVVCVFAVGSHQKNKARMQNQKLRFEIFADDKRIKQVVHHHATKVKEAISGVSGVPLARAHITVGGHYDAL